MEAENLAGLDRGGRAREEAEGRSAEGRATEPTVGQAPPGRERTGPQRRLGAWDFSGLLS